MTARAPSVQWRIMIRLLPMLALIFAGVLFWLGEGLKGTLYSANLEVARRSSMMAVNAVESFMLTEDAHLPWDRFGRKVARGDGTEIQIINTRGEVIFASDPGQRGISYSLADAACSTCHGNGVEAPAAKTAFIHDPDEAAFQVFAAPLENSEDCHGCHSKDGPKLGMVFVRQDLGPVDRQVQTVQIGIAIAGIIALALTVLTIRLLLARYLGRPLKTLVAGAGEIGTGNLDHTIELPGHAELAVLADTLNASTARLADLQKDLVEQERLAAVGETVAGLAHCLKNTLNGLKAGQYVIDRGVEKNDTEKLLTGWRVMKEGIRQVESLTFDMLYYVKDRVPERLPTDPNEVIREVAALLREMAAEKGVELRVELDEELGVAALDRTAIYRAVLNLATNAIDACAESESDGVVAIGSSGVANEIVLAVADSGIGMSDETRSQLFTRFFTTKPGAGTGLGLPVVKKIVEEHGGTLQIITAPGKGSEFRMNLPRAAPDQ